MLLFFYLILSGGYFSQQALPGFSDSRFAVTGNRTVVDFNQTAMVNKQLVSTDSSGFEAVTIDSAVSIGYGLALGDVDGDGKPDILLADKKQFVWYRNGDWKRFVMIDSLTEFDNVCIAARDLDNDGKVEVAVGAQWNPSETSNNLQSGSVHFLVRPEDPTQLWKAVALHHEPTIHRMKWVKFSDGKFYLVVAPLHGRGNQAGEGVGSMIIAYAFPAYTNGPWKMDTIANAMHLTHNFDVVENAKGKTEIFLAGKEGIRIFTPGKDGKVNDGLRKRLPAVQTAVGRQTAVVNGAGEIRVGKQANGQFFLAVIEPMHGKELAVYTGDKQTKRITLDQDIVEGHALGIADFSRSGSDQVVAGWRAPNKQGKTGIRLYTLRNKNWEAVWIDENGMACEDLQILDIDGDGKKDIVASGRATHNLKIYYNRIK